MKNGSPKNSILFLAVQDGFQFYSIPGIK